MTLEQSVGLKGHFVMIGPVYSLAIALSLGMLIGLERGWQARDRPEGQRVAGIRTYALIGLLGGVCALEPGPWLAAVGLGIVGLLVGGFHYLEAQRDRDLGLTSLFAALLTFGLGVLAVRGQPLPAAAAATAAVILLASKSSLHAWVRAVSWPELRGFLVLVFMSALVLPLMPSVAIDPWGALVPSEIWFLAVLIAALSLVGAQTVYVVPVFAGRGFYTGTLIPREIGLTGQVTEREGRRVLYTEPAGTHPRLPGLLACRADGMARACGWAPEATSLLLIAHGSSRPGGAGETPRAISAALAGMNHFAEVQLCFLEQEPFAQTWPEMITGDQVVALPLLVAQGMHAGQDIPPLFGLRQGETGPVVSHGRRVALATGLGAEPELEEIILDLVGGAAS